MKLYGRHVFNIALGACIISFSAVFVRLSAVHADAAGFYRVFFGACSLLPVVLVRREKFWCGWKALRWALVAALFFCCDLAAWHRSIAYLGPGLGTLFGNFQVFFVALAGFLVLDEKVPVRFIISIPAALFGIVLIIDPFTFTLRSDFGIGFVLGIVTSLCYTGYILALRRMKRVYSHLSSFSTMFIISALCSVFFLADCLVTGSSLSIPTAKDFLYMAAYGIICQGVAWVIIAESMPHVSASLTGLLLLLQPVLSYLWDLTIFHRRIGVAELAGVAIALGAIYLGSGAGVRSGKPAGSEGSFGRKKPSGE